MPRRALTLLLAALAAWAFVAWALVRPFLRMSGGDFANLHRGAVALLAGESVFARPELDYPPLVPVLLAPLGLLSLDAARVAWLLLSLAAVIAAMILCWQLAGADLAATAAVAVAMAVEGSTIPNLAVGQMQPLLLLFVAWGLLGHATRPARAAAAFGLAAAIKIWPGLLLLSWGTRRDRFRIWRSGAAAWGLGLVLPWALLQLATPAPHLPLAHGYWLGTPALLNFSAPAAILRASYGWASGTALPSDWIQGVSSAWSLAPERQRLSVAVSLIVLGAGLALIWLRLRLLDGQKKRSEASTPGAHEIACALIALALVAAPIAWYHYQLLQLPAFVLALAPALRRRQWTLAAALAATLVLLTRHELVATALELAVPAPATAAYWTGIAMPLLGIGWFLSRLQGIGGGGRGERGGSGGDERPARTAAGG